MSMIKVAQTAKVSVSTVARVVNNRPGIREETVRAVREAMRQLQYTPPPVALRRGPKTEARIGIRTRRIAMLLIAMDEPVIRRVRDPGPVVWALADRGLRLVLVPMPDPSRLPADIDCRQVDGVLLQGQQPTGAAEAKLRTMPVVWMMTRRNPDFWADYVEPDNRAVGRLAYEYLFGRGHRHLACLNLQPNYPAFRIRTDAFLSLARGAGLSATDLTVDAIDQSNQLHDIPSDAGVEQQVLSLMAVSPRPTGLFTSRHNYLPLVYRALERHGLRIGTDIEIVSPDYDPVLRSALVPTPAFIDPRRSRISVTAVEQLLWRMANPDAPGPVGHIVPPRLVPPDATVIEEVKHSLKAQTTF